MRLMKLKIAARHSDLARLQAYRVGDALKAKHPGLEVEYAFRASLGDINLNEPLWKMPEKGVFTEDFVRDLVEGTADLVVHSWKDLPTIPRPDTEIVATLPRADVRDVLLCRRDRLTVLKSGDPVRILTSSPRRSHNLATFFKEHLPFAPSEVSFEPVRGNIPTRLKKMMSQDVDGLIVAKAALDRLIAAPEAEFAEVQGVIRDVLAQARFMVLPLSVNPTAAAQGALAVEINSKRSDVREMLAAINCQETFECVHKERKILASHGGGCHQKIGVNVLRRSYGEITFLRGLTDAGVVLDSIDLLPPPGVSLVSLAASPEKLFPREGEEAAFFEREALARSSWEWSEKERFLFVARETAWPSDFAPSQDAVVWTAGLQTWRKLAERGVWVCGSTEGLGEDEPSRLEALLSAQGKSAPTWVKLTHEGTREFTDSTMKTCATYRLQPRATTPDLRGRTHFFWMSGSTFDQALRSYPEIRNAHHASGPGHTQFHLKRVLGPDAFITVHIGIGAWRQAVSGGAFD